MYDKKSGAGVETKPQTFHSEHDVIHSRLTGKPHEIKFNPLPGGQMPANPFVSLAQAHYMYAHPEKLGKKGLKEWSADTNYSHLPEHVHKKK